MARKNQNEDQSNENEEYNDSDDTFGLPEIEYEPLDRDQNREETTTESTYSYQSEETQSSYDNEPPLEETQHSSYSYTYQEEESSPVWPRALLIVLLILAVAGGGAWYFMYYKPKQDEEARQEALAQERAAMAAKKETARRDSIARIQMERDRKIADSLAALNEKPAEGTIEMLSGRTRMFYAVIASDIDDDLLMDYARKLSAKGVSSKIIPPFGGKKFYRLALAEGDNWRDTQTKADELKSEYGDGVWVIRY